MANARHTLRTRRHAVVELAPDLLLVFKPRGHEEAVHRHPHRQRLRIVRGRLRVFVGRRTVTLRPTTRPFTIAAGRAHRTVATEDTWLVAEAAPPPTRRRRTG